MVAGIWIEEVSAGGSWEMGCCGGSNNGGLNGRSGGFGGELQEGGSEGLADPDGFKECRSSGDATEAKQRLRVSTGHRERPKEGKSGQTVRAYTSCRRGGRFWAGTQGSSDDSSRGIYVGVVTMLYLHGLPAGVPRVVNGEPGEGGRWAR